VLETAGFDAYEVSNHARGVARTVEPTICMSGAAATIWAWDRARTGG
jgi:hypothetical protein